MTTKYVITEVKTPDFGSKAAIAALMALNPLVEMEQIGNYWDPAVAITVAPDQLVYPEGWYFMKSCCRNKHNSSTGFYSDIILCDKETGEWYEDCKGFRYPEKEAKGSKFSVETFAKVVEALNSHVAMRKDEDRIWLHLEKEFANEEIRIVDGWTHKVVSENEIHFSGANDEVVVLKIG